MELLIAGIVGGVLLALVVFKIIYLVVGPAVDNLVNWVVITFGNDYAVARHLRNKEQPPETTANEHAHE